MSDSFAELEALARAKKLPPVNSWQPQKSASIDILIDSKGHWYHEGKRILRQSLVDVFATVLRKESDIYYLVTPAEKLAIKVEDVPFIAVDFETRGHNRALELVFATNVGDSVVIDSEHGIWLQQDTPYLHVRQGLNAKIHRNAYYRLLDHGVVENNVLVVYSRGTRWELGSLEEVPK